jgi:hypothetical protein
LRCVGLMSIGIGLFVWCSVLVGGYLCSELVFWFDIRCYIVYYTYYILYIILYYYIIYYLILYYYILYYTLLFFCLYSSLLILQFYPPLLFILLDPYLIFCLYSSLLIILQFYSSLLFILLDPYLIFYLSFPSNVFSSSHLSSSFPIPFTSFPLLPNIHSILVGTYIYLFILFSSILLSFILYLSVLGYTYLYSNPNQNNLTPHVLSEWMVEVCGAYLCIAMVF